LIIYSKDSDLRRSQYFCWLDILSIYHELSMPNIQSRSIQADMYYTKEKSELWTETHFDNSIENRDIELDSFVDKNPQRKDRTNSGCRLIIYSKEDIRICRYHELSMPNIQSRSIQADMYYTKEKSELWHELQQKSFHLYHFQVRVSCKCRSILNPILDLSLLIYRAHG
jgi:hypothetical protein